VSLTPEQRSARARLGAYTRWAYADRQAESTAARDRLLAQFADAPDPEAALRAHMTRLALRSSQARAARKSAPQSPSSPAA
jgi:hypothetical protein